MYIGDGPSTRIFVFTSINAPDLEWVVDSDHLALSASADIGTNENRLSSNKDTSRLQAISLGQPEQTFISILYVTDDTVVNVSCLSGGNRVDYPSDFYQSSNQASITRSTSLKIPVPATSSSAEEVVFAFNIRFIILSFLILSTITNYYLDCVMLLLLCTLFLVLRTLFYIIYYSTLVLNTGKGTAGAQCLQ